MSFDKKKVIAALCGVLVIGAVSTCVYCSQYEQGNEYVVDKNGNVVANQKFDRVYLYVSYDEPEYLAQYSVHNRWPEWCPLYKERYGLIDLKTGEVSEPKFTDFLIFQDDGYAWDYDGHFVDRYGNIVVDCDFWRDENSFLDNPRKFALHTFKNSNIRTAESYFEENQKLLNSDQLDNEQNVPYFGVFSDNDLCYFYSDGKYGYMNLEGEVVIPAKYNRVKDFSNNGRAMVEDYETRLWGIIDENGDYVLEPCMNTWFYNKTLQYYYGTRENSKYGLVDSNGQVLLEYEYDSIWTTSSGEFVVVKKDSDSPYVYMDANFNPLFESEYGVERFSSKMKLFEISVPSPVAKKEKLYGLMDTEGNVLLEPIYERIDLSVQSIHDGEKLQYLTCDNCAISIDTSIKEGLTKILNQEGMFLSHESDGLYYLCDRTGKHICDEGFLNYDISFRGSYAIASNKDGLYGAIDTKGQWVTELCDDRYKFVSSTEVGVLSLLPEDNKVILNDGSIFEPGENEMVVAARTKDKEDSEIYYVIRCLEEKK